MQGTMGGCSQAQSQCWQWQRFKFWMKATVAHTDCQEERLSAIKKAISKSQSTQSLNVVGLY